jgi:PAS domain S-box-containing protein
MQEAEPPHKKPDTLPKSKEIYDALLASSRDAILGLDRAGTIIFWNKGAEQIFGHSVEEMLGHSATRLIAQKQRKNQASRLNAFLSENSGRTGTIEFEALRKDGSTFLAELSLSTWQQNGRFVGFAIGRNITERRQMEQALIESAEHYSSLFANSLEAIFSVHTDSDVLVANKALERLSDYCLTELSEMRPINTIPPENREHIEREVERMLSADEPIASIVREIFREDGKRILVERYLNSIKRKTKLAGFQGLRSDMAAPVKTEEQLENSFVKLARIVSRVIECCDPYTAGHQQKVAELARLVGEKMGLTDDIAESLYLCGLLHDIGKVSIPRSILTKPGPLVEEEWALIRAHTRQGYNILKDVNLPWPVATAALQHHERLDGSGYPDGLKGEELSLEVSILAVCDVVEAMGSHRPYRPARTTAEIVKELTDGRGTEYNASVVDVLLSMIESGELLSMWNRENTGDMPA